MTNVSRFGKRKEEKLSSYKTIYVNLGVFASFITLVAVFFLGNFIPDEPAPEAFRGVVVSTEGSATTVKKTDGTFFAASGDIGKIGDKVIFYDVLLGPGLNPGNDAIYVIALAAFVIGLPVFIFSIVAGSKPY